MERAIQTRTVGWIRAAAAGVGRLGKARSSAREAWPGRVSPRCLVGARALYVACCLLVKDDEEDDQQQRARYRADFAPTTEGP
jgi:hypothetical protein